MVSWTSNIQEGITIKLANLLLIAAMVVHAKWAHSEELVPIGKLQIPEKLKASTDISGIAFSSDAQFLFLAADEGGDVQILQRDVGDATKYELLGTLNVLRGDTADGKEADLEGLAVEGKWLYALGSHSMSRKKIKGTKTRAENRVQLNELDVQKSRRQLVRIRIDSVLDETPEIEQSHLWNRIEGESLLEPFTRIPSKENGIDLEGIAVEGKRILVGFRSPILRDGFAIVMDTRFDEHSKADLLFIQLGNMGIRDMARLASGRFLLLCGPGAEQPGSYSLKLWNGVDGMIGTDIPASANVIELGVIPAPEGKPDAKAEGVAIQKFANNTAEVVIVYDGISNGAQTIFSVPIPE